MADGVTPELLELVAKVRASLKVAHGQMREVERALASLPQAQERPTIACPDCGPIKEVTSLRKLMEHRENVHGEGVEVSPWPAPNWHAKGLPTPEEIAAANEELDRLLPKRDDA